ncbi:MAG: alpha/beta hydrolase [Actinomycetota bacterium]|nr:alpha/beta hydrolase [Actinomycetota bacterium]
MTSRPRWMLAALAGVAGAATVRFGRARRAARIWRPPAGDRRRAGPLAVRTLGEAGPPVLLLHGLVASGVFWGAAYDGLADGHRLIVPDLLGFGSSDRPVTGYGPDDHVRAVLDCLDALGVDEPVTIGAHSLGCLVALRMAALHPDRVRGIVGFGPPVYPDGAAARAHIGAAGPMARLFVLPGPVAERACDWLCEHHRIATALAVLTHPRLPTAIAADAVRHSWASYSQTMTRVILEDGAREWVEAIVVPVELVAGDHDPVVDAVFLASLAPTTGIDVRLWPGRHDLPLVDAWRCEAAIADFLVIHAPGTPPAS